MAGCLKILAKNQGGVSFQFNPLTEWTTQTKGGGKAHLKQPDIFVIFLYISKDENYF